MRQNQKERTTHNEKVSFNAEKEFTETNPNTRLAGAKTRFCLTANGFVWVRLPPKMGLFTGIEPIRCVFNAPGFGISSLTLPGPTKERGILNTTAERITLSRGLQAARPGRAG